MNFGMWPEVEISGTGRANSSVPDRIEAPRKVVIVRSEPLGPDSVNWMALKIRMVSVLHFQSNTVLREVMRATDPRRRQRRAYAPIDPALGSTVRRCCPPVVPCV